MSEGSHRGSSAAGSRAYESFAESFEQAYRRLRVTGAAAALSAAGVVACNPAPEPSGQAGSTTTAHPGGAGGTTGGTGGVTGGTGGTTGGTGGTTGGTGGITGGTGGVTGGTGGTTGGTGGVAAPCGPPEPGMSGGVSDTGMVSLKSFSVQNGTTVLLKVRVTPVPGADLAKKAIFVAYRTFFDRGQDTPLSAEVIVQATYAATLPDGGEEWHAAVSPSMDFLGRTPLWLFRVWYQDGAGGLYFDDNHGEEHAVHCLPSDAASGFFPCTISKTTADLTITDAGLSGHVEALAPRLDPDDVAVFKWTPDNWTTVHEVPMSVAEVVDCSLLRWSVDLDIPGTFVAIKYVFEYKHGTTNGAKTYKFWDDNNGTGYLVLK